MTVRQMGQAGSVFAFLALAGLHRGGLLAMLEILTMCFAIIRAIFCLGLK